MTAIGADETVVRVKGEKAVVGVEPSRQDRRMGLGQGEDMEAATDWSCPSWLRRCAAPFAGGAAPSEIRPQTPNRFWDAYDARRP